MTRAQRFVRRISLVVLVVWVAVLAGLLVQRQLRRSPPPPPLAIDNMAANGEQPLRMHRGFVHTVTLGSEPSFRVAAREAVEYGTGWFELRNVEVSLYHEGEVAYGLAAERARFNENRQEAEVTGAAQLSLRGGVAVHATGFTVRGPERLVESQGPVSFAGQGWGGAAGLLVTSLADDVMHLSGGISVSWRRGAGTEPAIVVLAPSMRYVRKHAKSTFEEGITVLRGGLRFTAAGAEMQLAGNEGMEFRRAILYEPVELDGQEGATVEASAGNTVVDALGDGRLRVNAQPATALGWVQARWREAGVGWREVTAQRLIGEGAAERWEWLEGQGGVCVAELRPGEERTEVESARLRLDFEKGRPTVATASDQVLLKSGAREASGDRLVYSLATRGLVMTPARGGRVVARSPEGEMRADRLEGQAGGAVIASGSVTGEARRAPLWGAKASEEPVLFATSEVRTGPQRVVVLEGNARLWQGQRLVRADRLDYDQNGETVRGQGSVLTQAELAGSDEGLRVRARTFSYDRTASVAVYEGDVIVEDARATVRCQRLVANLGPGGEVLVATLAGGVRMLEVATGRTVEAERGRMVPPEDLIELWGSPVVVHEPDGNQVKANRMIWRRATGSLVMLGEEDNPTETLYYPQRTPTAAPAATPPGRTP